MPNRTRRAKSLSAPTQAIMQTLESLTDVCAAFARYALRDQALVGEAMRDNADVVKMAHKNADYVRMKLGVQARALPKFTLALREIAALIRAAQERLWFATRTQSGAMSRAAFTERRIAILKAYNAFKDAAAIYRELAPFILAHIQRLKTEGRPSRYLRMTTHRSAARRQTHPAFPRTRRGSPRPTSSQTAYLLC